MIREYLPPDKSLAVMPVSTNRYPGYKKSAEKRNAPCPCGSGKKYKKCCLNKEENDGNNN
jgi:uncharacterized protein YecA (UPF0149 family)